MPAFGKSSLKRFNTLHPDLQLVMTESIKLIDFSIVAGHRGEAEQNLAFEKGNSKAKFPQSKHNCFPSKAVDVVPWPTQYADERYIYLVAGIIKAKADQLGIKLIWGGDWDGDGDMNDQSLKDPYHFELAQ